MRTPFALIALFAVLGCSASEPPTTSSPAASQATPLQPSTEQALSQCVKIRKRERACTTEYIPALVNLRVSNDIPAGIAARDKAEGRNALVAVAHKEWESDSADPEGFCRARVQSAPREQLQPFLDKASPCLDQNSCSGFVSCYVPMLLPLLR